MWYPKMHSPGWILSFGECYGIGPKGGMGIKDMYGLHKDIGILKKPETGSSKQTLIN